MIIKIGVTSYTFPNPDFGYSTSIKLSMDIQKMDNNIYQIWDDGIDFDYRKCTFSIATSLSETNTLIGLFTDQAKCRAGGDSIILKPEDGFFPFGPDKGDGYLEFYVRFLSVTPKPTVGHPEDYFNTEIEIQQYGEWPSYTPPEEVDEGSLQIGTITGLRYPQNMHDVDIEYAWKASQTANGTPYFNDMTSSADKFEAVLPMIMNESKAAVLIPHLTTSVRRSDVNIIPPANSYLFGRENDGTATYVCKFLQNRIEIVHEAHDRFITDLNFYRVSQ